jgi:hypothetical protein
MSARLGEHRTGETKAKQRPTLGQQLVPVERLKNGSRVSKPTKIFPDLLLNHYPDKSEKEYGESVDATKFVMVL